jgi:hypothetical protein
MCVLYVYKIAQHLETDFTVSAFLPYNSRHSILALTTCKKQEENGAQRPHVWDGNDKLCGTSYSPFKQKYFLPCSFSQNIF